MNLADIISFLESSGLEKSVENVNIEGCCCGNVPVWLNADELGVCVDGVLVEDVWKVCLIDGLTGGWFFVVVRLVEGVVFPVLFDVGEVVELSFV